MTSTTKFTVEAVKFMGVGGSINATGKRPVLHGFKVVFPNGTRVARAFTQSSAQKWTCELETKLRNEAEAWAKKCDDMRAQGII